MAFCSDRTLSVFGQGKGGHWNLIHTWETAFGFRARLLSLYRNQDIAKTLIFILFLLLRVIFDLSEDQCTLAQIQQYPSWYVIIFAFSLLRAWERNKAVVLFQTRCPFWMCFVFKAVSWIKVLEYFLLIKCIKPVRLQQQYKRVIVPIVSNNRRGGFYLRKNKPSECHDVISVEFHEFLSRQRGLSTLQRIVQHLH